MYIFEIAVKDDKQVVKHSVYAFCFGFVMKNIVVPSNVTNFNSTN